MSPQVPARFLSGVLVAVAWAAPSAPVAATPPSVPGDGGRRLEVLFLGSEDKFGHDPLARFRVIRRALGAAGVNFTYSATLDALEPSNLARYDVLLVFANHEPEASDPTRTPDLHRRARGS